jgi:hypothetical protein
MDQRSTSVSAELALGLLGPEHTIVPLMASVSYDCQDPYAVRMAFHVGTDEPVEWALARDLLADALHASQGIGDVRAWPSAVPAGPAAAGAAPVGAAAGRQILNIAMTSPFGHAQFQASAADVAQFLERTYQLVPAGEESGFLDFDAELADLLSQP